MSDALKLVKGEEHVTVLKGSDSEAYWREQGYLPEGESPAPENQPATAGGDGMAKQPEGEKQPEKPGTDAPSTGTAKPKGR
jgi:hypothetical protein